MQPISLVSAASQVAAYLRGEVERGHWTEDIPGAGWLAAELGVNRKTVAAALRQMSQARHVGKVVVRVAPALEEEAPAGAWAVTGGTGRLAVRDPLGNREGSVLTHPLLACRRTGHLGRRVAAALQAAPLDAPGSHWAADP